MVAGRVWPVCALAHIDRLPSVRHFVKAVHKDIEPGLTEVCAEVLNIPRNAFAGTRSYEAVAETAPLCEAGLHLYNPNLPQLAEFKRRGCVLGSRLVDLSAASLPGHFPQTPADMAPINTFHILQIPVQHLKQASMKGERPAAAGRAP